MANEAAEPSKGRTLFVSGKFADMVVDLAREAGVTVREYCDGAPTDLLAPLHRAALAARLKRAKVKAKAGG